MTQNRTMKHHFSWCFEKAGKKVTKVLFQNRAILNLYICYPFCLGLWLSGLHLVWVILEGWNQDQTPVYHGHLKQTSSLWSYPLSLHSKYLYFTRICNSSCDHWQNPLHVGFNRPSAVNERFVSHTVRNVCSLVRVFIMCLDKRYRLLLWGHL